MHAIGSTSVSSVAAQRRRRAPLNEVDLLGRVLAIHGEIVQVGLDPHQIVDVVTRRAQELTGAAGAVVAIVDGDELVYWSAAGAMERELGLRVDMRNSLSGLCALSNRILRCDDSEVDSRVDREKCRRLSVRSMLVAPLRYSDTTIGVLKVISPYVRAFGPNDEHALSLLNDLIAAMLSHAAHHAELKMSVDSRNDVERARHADQGELRERIRAVIEENDFTFVFQPIVRLDDGRPEAFEALARFPQWPERAPDAVFDLARDVGLGLDLELAVAGRAMSMVEKLPGGANLAVNLSPDTLASPAMEWLCLRRAPERLILEITEHSSIDDYEALCERVSALKKFGVRIAIDDAGAGFASLRHVLRLEPDLIKLDASLTHGIDSQARQQSLAAALVIFSKGTAAHIIAEGIETEGEYQTLKALGVPFGQGYFVGRPAPLPASDSNAAALAEERADFDAETIELHLLETDRSAQRDPVSDVISRHSELVDRIAHHLITRMPPSVHVSDLRQAGMIGLIEASRSFDTSQGASFYTHASTRIRGAMLDELRKGDWVPRSVYRRLRTLTEAIRAVEQQTGRPAKSSEIAAAMNIPIGDLEKLLADVVRGRVLSIDAWIDDDDDAQVEGEGGRTFALADFHESPAEFLDDHEFRHELAEAIHNLPERESLVISLHYEKELNLTEIGAVLDVSKSRVCQIHAQAIVSLRARLRDWIP